MKKQWAMATLGAALLAACGGGDDGGFFQPTTPPPMNVTGTDVPVSATTDANAAYDFVASVGSSKSETADPVTVGDAKLATSETDEPKPL